MRLKTLLKAKRNDLLDGFPFKAALKALSAEGGLKFKQAYLNELLESHRIEVIKVPTEANLMPGFQEVGIAGALTYSDGGIEVMVNSAFFSSPLTPVDRALRFQSIAVHELMHREQFSSKTLHAEAFRRDDELLSSEYLNDPLELESMAAEVAHDAIVAQFTAAGVQPRFDDLMAHAKHLTPESMELFQRKVDELKIRS